MTLVPTLRGCESIVLLASPLEHRYLHNYLIFKYNKLKVKMAPSPAGEGWGEENKIKALSTSPSSNLLPLEKALRLV